MSVLRHVRFCGDLVRVLYHAVREAYYRRAYRHIGPSHPDAWLVCRRMEASQQYVTRFLRNYTLD